MVIQVGWKYGVEHIRCDDFSCHDNIKASGRSLIQGRHGANKTKPCFFAKTNKTPRAFIFTDGSQVRLPNAQKVLSIFESSSRRCLLSLTRTKKILIWLQFGIDMFARRKYSRVENRMIQINVLIRIPFHFYTNHVRFEHIVSIR